MEEISLIDLYYILRKRAKGILTIVFTFTIIVVIFVSFLHRYYQSTSVILPLGSGTVGGGGAALLAQVAGITGSIGGGDRANIDVSVLLNSRSLAERVVLKLGLLEYYNQDLWDTKNQAWNADVKIAPTVHDAAVTLLGAMTVKKDMKAGGVVTINVEDKDPDMALNINNMILSELQEYLNVNTFTDAKRQRIFVENQLINNKRELLEVGKELGDFYSRNNVSTIDPFIDVDLGLVNDMTVGRLQDQKEDLENKRIHVDKVPQQVYLDYLGQKRQVLVLLNGMLSQQYEMAKMQESKEDVSFKIIDKPIKPMKPSRPQKKKAVIIGFIFATFFACGYALTMEYIESLKTRSGR